MAWGFTYDENQKILPTLLPGAKVWIHFQRRYLLGREMLMAQGYPVASLPPSRKHIDQELMSDLAGNAFPGTMVVAATLAPIAHVPWHKKSRKDKASPPRSPLPMRRHPGV